MQFFILKRFGTVLVWYIITKTKQMKKISVMVVAVLFSASVFANGAGLPKKGTTVNGNKPKTEIKKEHKQKDKQKDASKEKKTSKKSSKKPAEKK